MINSGVYNYLLPFGLAARIRDLEQSSATVSLAAEALGCTEAEIAKSLSFYGAEGPLLIVAAGTSSSALAMSLEELERAARAAGWVDVCKSV